MTKFHLDDVPGSSSHYTLLRNYLDIDHTFPSMPDHPYDDTRMTGGIRLDRGYYTNIVGNVIGQPSYPHGPTTERYECISNCIDYHISNRHMYLFVTTDSKVYSTTLRHGNFDYYNESIIWDPAIEDHNIPTSYYLTEKPAFLNLCGAAIALLQQ